MDNKKKKHKIKKIASALSTAVFVGAVCFCLFVAIQSLSRGYVSIGKTSFFRVITGSMEPSVSIGELIRTDNVDITEIKVGDVVCFRSKSSRMMGAIITHRVVDITFDEQGRTRLTTRGDANLSIDGDFVTSENFIGKMIWSSGESAMSNVIAFLSSSTGFFTCIVIPAILILLVILRENARNMKREMESLVKQMKENENAVTDSAEKEAESVVIDEEEYEQMRERIRKELMEEMKEENESEQS